MGGDHGPAELGHAAVAAERGGGEQRRVAAVAQHVGGGGLLGVREDLPGAAVREVAEGAVALVGGEHPLPLVEQPDPAEARADQQPAEEVGLELADQDRALGLRRALRLGVGRGGGEGGAGGDPGLLAGAVEQQHAARAERLRAGAVRGLAGVGEEFAVRAEDVERAVAVVLGEGGVQQAVGLADGGLGERGGERTQVRVALVERLADPVGGGVGAVALAGHDLGGHPYGRVVAAEEQQRAGPAEHQDGAECERKRGAGAASAGGHGGRRAGRVEELVPQFLQGAGDPACLGPESAYGLLQAVAAGEPAGLQEQPQQRALEAVGQVPGEQQGQHQQGAGGGQAEHGVAQAAGLAVDGAGGDHGQAERGGLVVPAGAGDGGPAGDPAHALAVGAAGQAAGGRLAGGRVLPAGAFAGGVDHRAVALGGELGAGGVQDGAGGVEDLDGLFLAGGDAGQPQVVGGDQQGAAVGLGGDQREGEQPGAGGGGHQDGGGRGVGDLGEVQAGQRDGLAAGGQQPAGVGADHHRAAPLVVRPAERGQDVGWVGGRALVAGGGPAQVGGALVQPGAQRGGGVLGGVLVGLPDGLRGVVDAQSADGQGGDRGDREQQHDQQDDGRADAPEQRHVGPAAGAVLPRRVGGRAHEGPRSPQGSARPLREGGGRPSRSSDDQELVKPHQRTKRFRKSCHMSVAIGCRLGVDPSGRGGV